MRIFSIPAVLLVLLASGLPTRAQDTTIQRSFGGETVRLDLSSGTFHIAGSPDGRIRVIRRPSSDPISVRLDVNAFGTRADVKVAGTSPGSAAEIELPARVDLTITVTGASLRVSGISGSKNISGDTGRVEVAVGHLDQYGRVTASVRTGSVSAPMGTSKNDQKSFEWTGSGAYDLRVQLNQGNIALIN